MNRIQGARVVVLKIQRVGHLLAQRILFLKFPPLHLWIRLARDNRLHIQVSISLPLTASTGTPFDVIP